MAGYLVTPYTLTQPDIHEEDRWREVWERGFSSQDKGFLCHVAPNIDTTYCNIIKKPFLEQSVKLVFLYVYFFNSFIFRLIMRRQYGLGDYDIYTYIGKS